jgi:cellobiose phosphorylase
MTTHHPTRLENAAGLRVEINANGSVRRMDCGDIILNLFLGNEIEGGLANIYLRRLGRQIEFVPLLGPHSPGAVERDEHGFVTRGEWRGIRFAVSLTLPPTATAWLWHVDLVNAGKRPVAMDLVYAQDLGLAHYGMVRLNEYYVSQYIDYTPLQHRARGTVLAIRQNLAMGGRNPWAAIGSLSQGIGYATDALQLHAQSARAGVPPPLLSRKRLASKRLQHEHSMAVIQDAPLRLASGESARLGFFGWFEADHPAATSDADLTLVDKAMAVAERSSTRGGRRPPGEPNPGYRFVSARRSLASTITATMNGSLFSHGPMLAALDSPTPTSAKPSVVIVVTPVP